MTRTPVQNGAATEAGFMLIEVMVSAMVLVVASVGVVMVLQTSVRAQGEQRHSTQAYAIAQEDQARLASMRVEELWNLKGERTITLNRTKFTVRSFGLAINDVTSAPSCGEGTYKVDYVQITSIVTWPGMDLSEKARIVSKLTPSKGSLDPVKGSLAVLVTNQAQTPMPGVQLSGSGGLIDTFTDASGCAMLPDLPEGNYSLTVSGEKAGLVNRMGKSSEVATVPVIGGDTKRATFEFDHPGAIPIKFKYRVGSSAEFKEPSTADTLVVNQTGMKEARIFGTPGGTRGQTITATPLFPFSSAYTIYAGSCASNNPDPEAKGLNAAAVATVIAPPGGTATAATIQLPAFELIVKKSGGAPLEGAKVTITDRVCKESKGNLVKRTYVTNTEGKPSTSTTGIAEPGLPWGKYDICVSANISGTNRRKTESNLTVQSLTSATTRSIELTSGSDSGSCS